MMNGIRKAVLCRSLSMNLSCWSGLSAFLIAVLVVHGASVAFAETKGSELRYRLQNGCVGISQCRTECEDAEARSRDLDSCLVEDDKPMTGTNRCAMEKASEMRAFYAVVGCLMYFYPHLNIPLAEENKVVK